jgi:hypothetical protein
MCRSCSRQSRIRAIIGFAGNREGTATKTPRTLLIGSNRQWSKLEVCR